MSVFRWRYTEECEGRYCCGDCDKCDKEEETTRKYEFTCPKCGAIALVWVDDITLNDEVVGQRTEVRCFSCGYRKVNYEQRRRSDG